MARKHNTKIKGKGKEYYCAFKYQQTKTKKNHKKLEPKVCLKRA